MASTYYCCILFYIEITVTIGQRIHFNPTEVTVREGGNPVQICGTLEGSIRHFQTVGVRHSTPSDSEHLVIKPKYFHFTQSLRIRCFTLATEDDELYETSREVRLSLFLTTPGAILDSNTIIVTVEDDEVQLGWEQTSYSVSLSEDKVNVSVVIMGRYQELDIIYEIDAVNGTAGEDDYIFEKTRVHHSVRKRSFTINIVRDIAFEIDRFFYLIIKPITPAEGIIISPNRTKIWIEDYNGDYHKSVGFVFAQMPQARA